MTTMALVIAWHEPEMTARSLRSLAAMAPAADRLLCVAQSFTDDERRMLESEAPAEAELVFLEENLGFAGAVNRGLQRAFADGFDWVLLLNNDATVDPDCLEACMTAATARPRIAAVSPAIALMDQPETAWWAGGSLSARWGITRHPTLGRSMTSLPPSGPTQFIPGCCVLFSMEAVRDIGTLADTFFMYYEDAEWCLRARQLGWELWYLNQPMCLHAVGGSSGQRAQTGLGVNSSYFLARNPLHAGMTAHPRRLRLTRVLAFFLVWTPYNVLRILRSPDRRLVGRAYLEGVNDALRKRMGPRGRYASPPAVLPELSEA